VLAWPVAVVALWSGLAWVAKGVALRRGRRSGPRVERLEDAMQGGAPPATEEPPVAQQQPRETEAERTRDRIASK